MKLIAEIGTNHGGDLERALQLVRIAKHCGATIVKFQHVDPLHFKPDNVWHGWNLREWYSKCRFTESQWRRVMAECRECGIGFLCTPQTIYDFFDLRDLGIDEVKISSDNLTNLPLLRRIVEAELPSYVSIGMATESELVQAMDILSKVAAPVTLMICTSLYPCPPEHVNLNRIESLIGTPCELGFSDHTIGNTAAVMAYAMGCRTFEKHLRLDGGGIEDGPDWLNSSAPWMFEAWTHELSVAERIMGSDEIVPVPGTREVFEMTR